MLGIISVKKVYRGRYVSTRLVSLIFQGRKCEGVGGGMNFNRSTRAGIYL